MKNKLRLTTFLSAIFAVLLCFGIFGIKHAVPARAEQGDALTEQGDALTEQGDAHSHCLCGGNLTVGDHTEHTDVTFSPWNGEDFNYDGEDGNSGSAFLYLADDVINGAKSCNRTDGSGILVVKSNQTLYLCLNGHSLKNGLTDNNVLDVYGTIYLCDCASEGTIGGRTSGSNSGSIWLSNGTLNMFGGNLTGSCGLKNGAGIYAKDKSFINMYGGKVIGNTAIRQAGGVYLTGTSSFVMYGGTIAENNAPDFGGGVIVDDGTSFTLNDGSIENNFSSRTGGGVFVSGGTFIMNGGTISGNKAANGGGVCMSYDNGRGSFTLNGGSVSNNTAFGNGGGVFIWDRATFTMNGGEITDNKATYGGGVCMYAANKDNQNLNMIFDIFAGEIKNNFAYGFGGGVCCFQYSHVNMDGKDKIIIDGNENGNLFLADKCDVSVTNLAENSKIGVSSLDVPKKNKPLTICNFADNGEYFFSDSADYVVKSDENGISLTADFYKSTINYESGCEQVIPPQIKIGFTESLEMKVTDTIPSAACRKFLGWTTNELADSAEYLAGDSVSVVGEITLFAVWENQPHKLSLCAEEKATCEQSGTKEYYVCLECGKKFIDKNAATEIQSDEELILPPSGHKFGKWQNRIEATAEKEGVLAHKDCEVCGKHFNANDEEIADLTIEKTPVAGESDRSESNATSESGDSRASGGDENASSCHGAFAFPSALGILCLLSLAFAILKLVKINRKNSD